jgi:hypothetical protein
VQWKNNRHGFSQSVQLLQDAEESIRAIHVARPVESNQCILSLGQPESICQPGVAGSGEMRH